LRYLRLLALYRWNQVHLRAVSVYQAIPWIAGKEFDGVGSTLTKKLKEFIEEPWGGNNGWACVERVSVNGEVSGPPARVRASFKNIYLVPKRAKAQRTR
jgi:hypothetical protein